LTTKQRAHLWARKQNRFIGWTGARDEETKKQRKKPYSGNLCIRPDHPRRQIETKFCTVSGFLETVQRFEFHQNGSAVFEMLGVEIRSLPLH